jgi:hypothetical protein
MQLRSLLALSFTLLGISAVTCFAAPGGARPRKARFRSGRGALHIRRMFKLPSGRCSAARDQLEANKRRPVDFWASANT